MGNYNNIWLKSLQAISLYKTFAIGSLIEKQRVQFPTLSIIPTSFPRYGEQEKKKAYDVNKCLRKNRRFCMSEKKEKIGFTIACVDEFAQH